MLCVRKPGNSVSENSRFPSKSCVDGSSGVLLHMGKKAMHATNDLDLDDVQRKYERSWIFSN